MGAIVIDSRIGEFSLIGAGAVITPGTIIPPGSMVLGMPGKVVRPLKDEEKAALRSRLTAEYAAKFASPYQTASTGSIDEVIEPARLRAKLICALRLLRDKRLPGTHENRGNIPL